MGQEHGENERVVSFRNRKEELKEPLLLRNVT